MQQSKIWQLVRGTGAYALGPALGLATAPILARALGVEDRGRLAAVLQPLTAAEALATFGVPAAVAFYVGRGYLPRQVMTHARRTAVWSLLITLIALIAYAPFVASRQDVPTWQITLLWLTITMSTAVSLQRGRRQGELAFSTLDLERVSAPSLRFLGIAALAAFGVSHVFPYALAQVAAFLVAGCMLFIPSISNIVLSYSKSITRRIFAKFAAYSGAGTVAIALNARLDQAILPILISSSSLGIYAVAVTLAEVPSIVTTVAARNLLAHAARGDALRALLRFGAIACGLCGLACLCLAVLAGSIVSLLFGDAYAAATPVVRVLTIATFLSGVGAVCSSALIGLGHPKAGSAAQAAGLCITVVLLGLLSATMTPVTAAWISCASQAAVVLTSVLITIRVGRRRTK